MQKQQISVTYPEELIVVVKRFDEISFYISNKELWIMDQRSWAKTFIDAGYNISIDDHSDRFDIEVLDEHTAAEFFKNMENNKYNLNQLRSWFLDEHEKSDDDTSEKKPSLYLDFDEKILISYYSEPFPFEKHIPKGWHASYSNFLEMIPLDARYW